MIDYRTVVVIDKYLRRLEFFRTSFRLAQYKVAGWLYGL